MADPHRTKNTDASVARLVAGCIAEDSACQAEFISRYSEFIERVIAARLKTLQGYPAVRADVEDIRQELLIRILRGERSPLTSLQAPERIHGWLAAISRNRATDWFRGHIRSEQSQKNFRQQLESRAPHAPDDVLLNGEVHIQITDAMAKLGADERLALQLYLLEGLKYAEVAEITRTNINTVAARIRRGRAKLQKLLEEVRLD